MKNNAARILAIVMAVYLVLGAAFYWIAGDSLHFTNGSSDTVTPKAPLGELFKNDSIQQSFHCSFDTLKSISVPINTMGRKNTDRIQARLLAENGTDLCAPITLEAADMKESKPVVITFAEPIENVKGQTLTLVLTSEKGRRGNAIAFYYGTSVDVDTGRITIPVEIRDTPALSIGDEKNGMQEKFDEEGNSCYLCMTVSGTDYHWFGEHYWLLYGVGATLLLTYLCWILVCLRKGIREPILAFVLSLRKYAFLIRQLVARDFKTKYKRSVLGMLWSFLNPLLTMSIQYVVFSTLFQSTIPNFVVYLLSGIICFNFFSEATNMCLMSIVGNATLINKVYVPKYIYPFSRTLSSCVNLLLSLIPLLLMMLITRTPITLAVLLVPFAILMLFLVSYGVGLILASMMVFFRDTQFLWGICSMLLMYLTPIFYPETIIPSRFLAIYRINPLYQVITFLRTLLIDGISPAPAEYLTCLICCLIPFLLGVLIFKRTQDKFVLNI